MPFLTTSDGCILYFSDWGDPHGQPVVFASAWALSGDMWHQQIPDLVDAGRRCVVYDRRGHGRSDRPGHGYEFDSLAADLAVLIEHLDLTDAILVGHSMGASEVVRYVTNYGTDRAAAVVLSAPTLPALLRTDDNPAGVDKEVFEEGWRAMRIDIGGWMSTFTNGDFNEYFGVARPMSDEFGAWTRRQFIDTPPTSLWPASVAWSRQTSGQNSAGSIFRRSLSMGMPTPPLPSNSPLVRPPLS
jgi:non-heme chloroperoxidase